MTGIDKITAHIEADAQAEAKAVLDDAYAKAKESIAEYDRLAHEEYVRIIQEGVKDCEDKVQRMQRLANMEAKKAVLAVKQDIINKAFVAAQDKIVNLPEDEYVEFLAKLASLSAKTGQEEIILNQRDKEKYGPRVVIAANEKVADKGLVGNLQLSNDVGGFAGGLILRQGSIEINSTIEILIELCRDEMSAQLAEVLFD
jgi:V/A-type H+-transporting ATPase subunit E